MYICAWKHARTLDRYARARCTHSRLCIICARKTSSEFERRNERIGEKKNARPKTNDRFGKTVFFFSAPLKIKINNPQNIVYTYNNNNNIRWS